MDNALSKVGWPYHPLCLQPFLFTYITGFKLFTYITGFSSPASLDLSSWAWHIMPSASQYLPNLPASSHHFHPETSISTALSNLWFYSNAPFFYTFHPSSRPQYSSSSSRQGRQPNWAVVSLFNPTFGSLKAPIWMVRNNNRRHRRVGPKWMTKSAEGIQTHAESHCNRVYMYLIRSTQGVQESL